MSTVKPPTVADRYLRSIGLAVGAVMVGVVAYPVVAALVVAGSAVSAASATSYDADSSSGSGAAFYVLPGSRAGT